MFLVPYSKLSEDQKLVIRKVSREDKNLFVEGPPGSGKTLISLYTLKDMVRSEAIKPLLLIYNHSLYGYLSSALEEMDLTDNIIIATKDMYFWQLARVNNIVVTGNNYEEKYTSILKSLLAKDLTKNFDITVVDEVQDLRKDEWELVKKISKRITSLGDFNQGIYKTDLTKPDVVQGGVTEELTDIFRFHKNIAKTAQTFSKSKETLEDKVSRIEQNEVQLLDVDSKDEVKTIADIITSLKHQHGRIGVISHNHEHLKDLQTELQSLNIESAYFRDNKSLRKHDFSTELPLLVTSHSAKGLEFEHVILFGFNEEDRNIKALRKQGVLEDIIYVSLTRTNTNLYIIRNSKTINELQKIDVETSDNDFTIDDIF